MTPTTDPRFGDIIDRYLPPLPVADAADLLANARALVALGAAQARGEITDFAAFQIAGIAVSRGYVCGCREARATLAWESVIVLPGAG